MERTIKELIAPTKDKSPWRVIFTDGVAAQYWADAKFGSPLEVGVTAECETEVKTHGEYTNTYLKRWGAEVPKGGKGGFPGRQPMSPEERRSIAAQAMIKAACELFSGQPLPTVGGQSCSPQSLTNSVIDAATKFMAFHDQQVSQATSNRAVAPDPNPAPGAPQKPAQPLQTANGERNAYGYKPQKWPEPLMFNQIPTVKQEDMLRSLVEKFELTSPQAHVLRVDVLRRLGIGLEGTMTKGAYSLLIDFLLNATQEQKNAAVENARDAGEGKAVIPQTEEGSYA